MNLKKHKEEWDELGEMDPLWAILSSPDRKFGKWELEDFFRTGADKIRHAMKLAGELGYPAEYKSALDFGCGVGRLSRALAGYFEEVRGVDISESMLEKARELNREIKNCNFSFSMNEHLKEFPDDSFDLICTWLVLQHVPGRALIKTYIREFVRVLKKDGLLIFQLPSFIPVKYRFQPRRRLYSFLRAVGVDKGFLYRSLGLIPIRMYFIPEEEVLALLSKAGARVLKVSIDNLKEETKSNTYYVTK